MSRRPRRTRAESIQSALQRVLRNTGLLEGMRERRAISLWPKAVGPALARVTEPLALRQGTLVVKVSGSGWRTELHHLLPEILARLNEGLEHPLREIRLVAGPIRRPEGNRTGSHRPWSKHRPKSSSLTVVELAQRARRAARQHDHPIGAKGHDD